MGAAECGGAAAAAGLMTMTSPARGGQRVAVERLAREAARSSRGPTRACDGPGWHPLASASRRSTWATAFGDRYISSDGPANKGLAMYTAVPSRYVRLSDPYLSTTVCMLLVHVILKTPD
eukprot:COSAG01_NODE_4669_length_4833_cov_2.424377_6_plen_119_part_01